MRFELILSVGIRLLDVATVCLAGSLTLYLLAWNRIHTKVSYGSLVFLFGALFPVSAVICVKFFRLYQAVQIVGSALAIAIPVVIGVAIINLLIRGELT